MGFFKRLPQIPQDVVDILDADRQPDHVGTDSAGGKILIRQLLVRSRRRMNDEALAIAHIREMGEELHVLNEFLPPRARL